MPPTNTANTHSSQEKTPLVPLNVLLPFILLTSLFAWWGLANNMTDTLLAAFKRIMSMTDAKTSLIQVVFYGLGYGLLAFPAAILIKKFSYKFGVLLGLGLYIVGALMFYPAMLSHKTMPDYTFYLFLAALWILSGGLSILETAANPYIVAMGPEETGTRRLNLAQSFNPLGSIMGIVIANIFILGELGKASAAERAAMPIGELDALQTQELHAVTMTYVVVGLILLATWIAILVCRMPRAQEEDNRVDFWPTMGRLVRNRHYMWGVAAQFFYVGAQIGVWSFTIRYCMQELNLESVAVASAEGITAEKLGGYWYLAGIILFVTSRFICTWLMKFIAPGKLLAYLSYLAIILCLIVAFVGGLIGCIALVGISACMSLMFPTIFGLAVRGLGADTKLGGAGVIAAIMGGAVITYVQGKVSDTVSEGILTLFGRSIQLDFLHWAGHGINMAYFVPLICFVVIAYYGAVACRKDLPPRIQPVKPQ
jgi:FHS family L-fucose permease-like MFS transporter